MWTGPQQRYMRHVVASEPYYQRVKRLREAAGLSQPELFRRSPGTGWETIRAIERPPAHERGRYPTPKTLAAVAEGLGVQPEEFPEYRLAVARELLDERQVGLEGALEALAILHDGLQLHEQRVFAMPRLADAVQQARAGFGPDANADPAPAGAAAAPKRTPRASKRVPE